MSLIAHVRPNYHVKVGYANCECVQVIDASGVDAGVISEVISWPLDTAARALIARPDYQEDDRAYVKYELKVGPRLPWHCSDPSPERICDTRPPLCSRPTRSCNGQDTHRPLCGEKKTQNRVPYHRVQYRQISSATM